MGCGAFDLWRCHSLLRGGSAGLACWFYGVGEDVLERGVAFAVQFGVREGFAGHHLFAFRGVVEEDRLDDRGLHQVSRVEAFDGVHIGVVGTCLVVHGVLDELEARQADGVEGEMVRAAGIARGESGCGEVGQGSEPLFEDRANGVVALEIDATDATCAIIQVVVGVERLPLLGGLQRAGGLARQTRAGIASGAFLLELTEVLFYVAFGAVQALLFSAPERDADGAAG